jgi:hypothetical protein
MSSSLHRDRERPAEKAAENRPELQKGEKTPQSGRTGVRLLSSEQELPYTREPGRKKTRIISTTLPDSAGRTTNKALP